jgi:multidrug efflux pump subunit AcrA (membrane-fusion protein)
MTMKARKRRQPWITRVLVLGFIFGGTVLGWRFVRKPKEPTIPPNAYYEVKRSDLLISVAEDGALKAVTEVVIRNSLAGESRIIQLAPEGAHVKKGELLVELDSSLLRDRLNEQELAYQDNLFLSLQAQENLKIQKSLVESRVKDAELQVELAQVDLEKYRDGDAPKQIKATESQIGIIDESVRIAREKYVRTQELHKNSNATKSELEADALSLKREQLGLEQSREDLRLMKKFDQPNMVRMLESRVQQAKDELERLKHRSAAEIAQAEGDLKTSEKALEVMDSSIKLQKRQLENAKIYAPQDGLVVYSSVSPFSGGRGGEGRSDDMRSRLRDSGYGNMFESDGRFRRGSGGGGDRGGGRGRGRDGGSGSSFSSGGGQGSSYSSGGAAAANSTIASLALGGLGSASGSGGQALFSGSGGQGSSGGGGALGGSGGSGRQGSSSGSSGGEGSSIVSYTSLRQSSTFSSSVGQGSSLGSSGSGGITSSSGSSFGSSGSSSYLGSGDGSQSGYRSGSRGYSSFDEGPIFSSATVIEEGATVRQRQELIKLPDVSRMLAEVKIEESRVRQVTAGMSAFVRIETLPGRRFKGTVRKVGILPDTQASWANPNNKVYATEVLIEDDLPELKPGVSARAEIIITNLHNVLSVPIQAVTTHKGEHVCFVKKGSTAVPVPVTTGWFNDRFVEINSGLKAGDRVLLALASEPDSDSDEPDADGTGSADTNAPPSLTNSASGAESRGLPGPARPKLAPSAPSGEVQITDGPGSSEGTGKKRGRRQGEELMNLNPEEQQKARENRGQRGQGKSRRPSEAEAQAPPGNPQP